MEWDVQHLVLAIPLILAAAPVAAQSDLLSSNGRYNAITINGVVLPVQDVQAMLAAGLLRLDPVTQRFSLGANVANEAQYMAALKPLPLQKKIKSVVNNWRTRRHRQRADAIELQRGDRHFRLCI